MRACAWNTHSRKRWKPGKKVRWQGRKLVVGQIKRPASRRHRELGNQLKGILRKANKQKTNIYSQRNASMHVCMYDCLRSESESASHSSPPQLKGVRVISTCARASVLTAVVHAHKVDKQTTDTYLQTHESSIQTTMFSAEKERDKPAGINMHVCIHVPNLSGHNHSETNKITIYTHRHTSIHVCVHECLKSSYTCVKHKYDCAFTEWKGKR